MRRARGARAMALLDVPQQRYLDRHAVRAADVNHLVIFPERVDAAALRSTSHQAAHEFVLRLIDRHATPPLRPATNSLGFRKANSSAIRDIPGAFCSALAKHVPALLPARYCCTDLPTVAEPGMLCSTVASRSS